MLTSWRFPRHILRSVRQIQNYILNGLPITSFRTETEPTSMQFIKESPRIGSDWEYFGLPSEELIDIRLIPLEDTEGLVEPVLLVRRVLLPQPVDQADSTRD